MKLFLCGDVMTGRGVDQILPHPNEPTLHEGDIDDARDYVRLAEEASGPIPRPVDFAYVWGAALSELGRERPDVRVANLETSVTSVDTWEPKGINYRMHPANAPVLVALGLDLCVLANNHVLDYGPVGLAETLRVLHASGIATVGAGLDLAEAAAPARVGRALVFAFADESAGVPSAWAAGRDRPGVNFLPDLSRATAARIGAEARRVRRPGEVVVISLHWGGNWGYEVSPPHVQFAHALVEEGIDLVYGHSSHHPRPIEVYRDRLILYGCGDFLDDYEGIQGYEVFRGDLVLMYFPELGPSGALGRLRMVPLQIRKLRLVRASSVDARWLAATLDGVSRPFGASVALGADGSLALRWE